jgi:nucleotide-binding universal stress UspA family protein
MSLVERILLPIDFSERSFGAARYVEALADKEATEISVVHVTTPLNYELSALDVGGTVLTELNADRTQELKEQLAQFADAELKPYRVRRHLLEGDPAKRLVEFADQHKIDLIVMPTHGYGLFRRFLLGSVTAKVLHDAHCPVWTGVHLEDAPVPEKIHFERIMVAVDLCPAQAMKAISWGAQMAERCGAEIVIAHAYPTLEGRAGEYFDPNWRSYFTQIANDEIMHMQQKLGTNADLIMESGDPAHVVCNLAAVRKSDLLVIGRGSAAGMFGRLRANAYAIIRQSPCPVVSV